MDFATISPELGHDPALMLPRAVATPRRPEDYVWHELNGERGRSCDDQQTQI
jgi:hypothetical protein